MEEAKHLDPLNPPEGVICLCVIQTIDPDTGIPVVDIQGHIRNEAYALDLLERAKGVLSEWHKMNKESEMQKID
jgi:hypothetical protein